MRDQLIKKFKRNSAGKDYVVGDIHGEFTKLSVELSRIGFNRETDRLFSCGDLVDRGGESHHAVEWLREPWFHPVRGNHDDYVCRYDSCDTENWVRNGGQWFQSLSDREKTENCDQFSSLPLAIEIETETGAVGIVHANPYFKDWADLPALLSSRVNRNKLMWCRERIQSMDETRVSGIDYIFCGHTPINKPLMLGNVVHIETAGWHANGHFTIVDINTMAIWRGDQ